MFTIEKMSPSMREEVLEMVGEFYQSSAVSHPVPMEVLERTFEAAVSEDPVLTGYVLKEEAEIVGFAYITTFYACEVGGKCLMLEEIHIKKKARGKGYGTAFIKWVIGQHRDVKRVRLEVTADNERAIALYKRLGFQFLDYGQMALEL